MKNPITTCTLTPLPTPKKKKKEKKIIKLSTVMPELVTLDCSLKYVLQVPKTQSYHS